MLEVLGLVAIVFLIVVVFYMQRHAEISILQLEQSQVDAQFAGLLEERQPIVIRGVQPPKGLTKDALQKSNRLAQFPVGDTTLSISIDRGISLKREEREELADQLSLPIWANHSWLPLFQEYSWIAPIVGCLKTEVVLGGIGMTRLKALYTCIIPTEGAYIVSLLSKSSESFLPANWEHRFPSSLTSDDTPLVADLKYIDVVVTTGNAICVPAHIILSIEPKDSGFHSAAIIEYHEPVSILAKSLR